MKNTVWPIKYTCLFDQEYGVNGNLRVFNEYELLGIVHKLFSIKVAVINVNQSSLTVQILDPHKILENKVIETKPLVLSMFKKNNPELTFYDIIEKDVLLGSFISFEKIPSKELKTFRSIISRKLELIEEKFIRTQNDKFINSLKLSIHELSRINYRLGFERYWKKVEKTLELMTKAYPATHVAVFALKSVYTFDDQKFEMVASHGLSRYDYDKYTYEISNIELNYRGEMLTSIENDDFLKFMKFKGAKLGLNPEEDLIRILPAPFSIDSSIIIWVKYNNSIWPRLIIRDPNSFSSRMFHKLITSFYTVLVSTYSSLLSSHTLDMIEESWRVLSHETGQISAGIERLRKAFIENKRIQVIESNELDDVNKNLRGLINQYNYLSLNTKALIKGTPEIHLEKLNVFGEYLFKWQSIYKMATDKKNIQILVPTDFKTKDRPPIYTDSLLLEQTLYNLINNAVKYGREGTKIHINYYHNARSNYPTKIEVTNYASEILRTQKIWELFGREDNNPEEGIGIGLFISREITKALNGKIELIQEEISKYNVTMLNPLINMYKEISQKHKKTFKLPSLKSLKAEKKRLTEEKQYNQVIVFKNRKQLYRPKFFKILKLITKPTYSIKFQINLPK